MPIRMPYTVRQRLVTLLCLWITPGLALAAPEMSIVEQNMVGNVYGRIADVRSGQPIGGAAVALFPLPMPTNTRGTWVSCASGVAFVPESSQAVRRGMTDKEGDFLINAVPTPYPGKDYLILVQAEGYAPLLIGQVRVLPGAVMALRLDGSLSRGAGPALYYPSPQAGAPVRYRHEEAATAGRPSLHGLGAATSLGGVMTAVVFATREGLVGGTTANGHLIVARDHFVALPSRRALNANDSTRDFMVEIVQGNKAIRVPVWDIGPWNTQDDYWNPPAVRETWPDLATGLPEAQAAYLNKYNNGLDERGRRVANPAGIDLADGTFWDDLGYTDNSWLTVKFPWLIGVKDQVRVTANSLNVRDTPGGAVLHSENLGALGTVLDGPLSAAVNGVAYIWWRVQWNDGQPTGWCAETYLVRIPARPSPAHLWLNLVNNKSTLTLSNLVGTTWSIQSSVDPAGAAGWAFLTNLTMASSFQVWTDPTPLASQPRRFYRAVWMP
jgi:hypothetical protein